jgi:hypothetical protein
MGFLGGQGEDVGRDLTEGLQRKKAVSSCFPHAWIAHVRKLFMWVPQLCEIQMSKESLALEETVGRAHFSLAEKLRTNKDMQTSVL